MNCSNLKSQDLTLIRDLFPITKELIYLNHAGTGPLSLPAKKAIDDCMAVFAAQAEFQVDDYFAKVKNWRAIVASLINAAPEEITFVHNTSEALYIALVNIPLNDGDKVLVMDDVFPAIRYVVQHNLPYANTLFVPFLGRDPIEVIKNNLDKDLKVVVLELVHYLTGEMIALKPLIEFCREKDIYLVVDGIQGIGAMNFDVQETDVDFLACGAGKWLFGPTGAGFLYVNKRHFGILKGLHAGWLGAEWGGFNDCQISPPLYPDARMFELGSRNIVGISALVENIKILLNYGVKNVQKKILSLKNEMRKRFIAMDYKIVTPFEPPQSGILTVRPPGNEQKVYQRLREANVIVSLRSGALRFSPHFYNTKDEVEKIFKILNDKRR